MADDRPTIRDAVSAARDAFRAVSGRDVEGVIGVDTHEDGFTVTVEVLELQRVPRSTDVVAVYDVELDTDGEMTGYHRVQRGTRASLGEDLL